MVSDLDYKVVGLNQYIWSLTILNFIGCYFLLYFVYYNS